MNNGDPTGPLPEGAKGWFILLSNFVGKPGGVALLVLAAIFFFITGYFPSQLTANQQQLMELRKDIRDHEDNAHRREERYLKVMERLEVNQSMIAQWLRISVCEQVPRGEERNKCYAIGLIRETPR